jgi:hypothetical protein
LKFLAQRSKLYRRADGVNFHTAIAQILGVALDPYLPGRAAHKETKPHPLYGSADAIQFGLERFVTFLNGVV